MIIAASVVTIARMATRHEHQVRPLQEQIQHYENKIRLHDVVGGIGFIVGLAGVSFYFAGKRKNG